MGFALRFWACGPAVALVPIGTRTGYFLGGFGEFLGLATCPNAPPVGDARRTAVGDFFGGFGEFLGGDFFGGKISDMGLGDFFGGDNFLGGNFLGGNFFASFFTIINTPLLPSEWRR